MKKKKITQVFERAPFYYKNIYLNKKKNINEVNFYE